MQKKQIMSRMMSKKPSGKKGGYAKPRSSGTMVRGVMNILGGPMKAGLK